MAKAKPKTVPRAKALKGKKPKGAAPKFIEVSELNKINIGAEVPQQLQFDVEGEYAAVKSYNEGIKICVEAADNATKDVLDGILEDEDAHVDEIEALQTQIEQMGLQIFLTTQVAG